MLGLMQEQSRQLSFEDLTNDGDLSIPPPLPAEPPRPARLPSSSEALAYVLERSARRKSTIQISVLPDLTVRVVAPVRTPRSRIDALVRERQAWILKRRDEVWRSQLKRVERRWESGERLPYLDEELELRIRPVAGQKMVQAIRQELLAGRPGAGGA